LHNAKRTRFETLRSNFIWLLFSIAIAVIPLIFADIIPDGSAPFFILFGILTFIAPLIYSLQRSVERFAQQSQSLIGSSFDVSFLGGIETSEKLLFDELTSGSVTHVENTLIGIRDFEGNPHKEKPKTYSQWFMKENSVCWTDLVSTAEFFSARYSSIKVPRKYSYDHKVVVLREGTSALNFIILRKENTNDRSAVYFGWIPHKAASEQKIFRSERPELIQLFTSYFDSMKGMSWNALEPQGSVQADGYTLNHTQDSDGKLYEDHVSVLNKRGQWITLAYDHQDASRRFDYQSVAFVDVNFSGERCLVEAHVYDYDGNAMPSFASLDAESSFYMNNLFLNYRLKDGGTTGICYYKFLKEQNLGDVISGAFCDNLRNERLSVVGTRSAFNVDEMADLTPSKAKRLAAEAVNRMEAVPNSRLEQYLKGIVS